ncbi:MAG TPA: BPTI/Kunitz domain-containing protein [Polyangiaceae bacterium]|nr:BPTI/Kunitz domain-containing protein [Polyangiaceae bacterium]
MKSQITLGAALNGLLLCALPVLLVLACGNNGSSSSSSQAGSAGLGASSARAGEAAEAGAEPGSGGGSVANGGAATGSGGSSSGGSDSGGSPSGGRAAACDQPGGETGPCNALFHAWFFDKMRGACMPYVYGGCGASDNHFESQLECEGACGGALYSKCPEAPSDGSCDGSVTTCRYTPEGCACLQTSPASFNCVPADAECGEASEYPTSCTCASGSWHCAARPMP